MSFLVKAAQIAHKDPKAEIYCFDTKQVSFEALHGIPRIYIFDDPVTGMDKIWNGLYSLMRGGEPVHGSPGGRARLTDFHDVGYSLMRVTI